MPMGETLSDVLKDSTRPAFLFGSTPPREGTTENKAREACAKFAARSAVLATDGFIVYDIQDEGGRTTMERPFPFRKTMDAAQYASYFRPVSGKQCVVYKSICDENSQAFESWLDNAINHYGHNAFAFVGAPSSSVKYTGPTLSQAGDISKTKACAFGCVCIPERHTNKGNEHTNMLRKMESGAEYFITQGIFASGPLIKLLNEYGDLCRKNGRVPKKVILTFAPCGRPKTMTFIKWLGMFVPEDVERRILDSESPVQTSVSLLKELLGTILLESAGSGVPLGLNVESLSIFKEEIDAAHELFQSLQALMLNSRGSPWAVRWFCVRRSLAYSAARASEDTLDDFEERATKSKQSLVIPAAAAPGTQSGSGKESAVSGGASWPKEGDRRPRSFVLGLAVGAALLAGLAIGRASASASR